MSLVDLGEDVESEYNRLDGGLDITLDTETKNELALLNAALEPDDASDIVRRAMHVFFQRTVETGSLDFHLRRKYDCTYDEYLSGMTFDTMANGGIDYPNQDDERRYQF